jgi:type I restriction enzyme S subunit
MSFSRYQSYKYSGVEWLGEIPEHWSIKAIKHVVTTPITDGPHETPAFVDEGIPFVSAEAVAEGKIDFDRVRGFVSEADHLRFSQKYCPQKHDIFLIKSGATTGVTAIVETGRPFNIWSPLAAIRVGANADPYFVLNFLRSKNFQEAITLNWSFGTQQNIGMGVIQNLAVAVPPLSEQSTIAAFLNRETAKIDALVEEQKRMIGLLIEKRQAIISHAVTKGLDPKEPMKHSGVEWLGEVPEDWEVGTLIRVATRVVVGIAEAAVHAYVDNGTPILRSTNIRPGRIVGEMLYVRPDFAADRNTKLIHAGDLVTVRTGHAGVTAVVPNDLDGCQCFTMLVTSLSGASCPFFYCYWLNSVVAQHYFSIEAWGSAQPNISVPILKATPVPIPPFGEQVAIVQHLDRETSKLDALSHEAEKTIALLKERRSALISAAVTGRIDVRGSVPVEAEAA